MFAARSCILDWKEIEERLAVVRALVSEVVPVSIDVHEKAVELAQDYGFSFYDALIVAAAVALDCRELLAEDMQDGRVVMNLTIRKSICQPVRAWPLRNRWKAMAPGTNRPPRSLPSPEE